jgi:hypothetical protein
MADAETDDAEAIGSQSFEITTARQLGKFETLLQLHQEEIKGINAGVANLNERFDHLDADLHLIKEAIDKIQNPTIDVKTLKRDIRKFFAWLALLVIGASSVITWLINRYWPH